MKTSGYLAAVGVIYKSTAIIILRTITAVAYASLLSFYSPVLLAGDIGVEGSVTATTFVGSGDQLTGVVKTEVDPVVDTLSADKWCKADATGRVINCDQDAPSIPAGIEIGDMQYWDGAAWVLVPAPPAREVTLTSCKGVPRWSSTSCFYAIGDTGPAGGIVFHITDGGQHGLESALTDHSSVAEWGCYMTDITGADGTAVGTGAQNTADIVADCDSTPDNAAEIADAYSLNGYGDWFLPSIDELNLLYQQKASVGGFENVSYWSSSEASSVVAWLQDFGDGVQGVDFKNTLLRVRAIRAF